MRFVFASLMAASAFLALVSCQADAVHCLDGTTWECKADGMKWTFIHGRGMQYEDGRAVGSLEYDCDSSGPDRVNLYSRDPDGKLVQKDTFRFSSNHSDVMYLNGDTDAAFQKE